MVMKFLLAAAALSAPLVAGHGYMGLPKTTFPKGGDITAPAGTINSSQFKAPSGMSFTTDPESNAKAFAAWIKTSDYSSLKDLIVKKGGIGECGNSAVGDPQPLPDKVEWTHGASEGFTASHQGPCEVWCDDKMAFHDDNCAKNYPSAPAKLPYDKSKCLGAKKLTTYWLALHDPNWQEYVGCAALSGASAGGSSSAGGASSAGGSGTSPTPTTATPTVKPSSPSGSSGSNSAPKPAATPAPAANDDDCDEDLPEPDCDEDLPEPETGADAEVGGDSDADCDEDLPEPDCDEDLPEPAAKDDDCDEDLPEPETGADADAEVGTSNIGFGTIKAKGGEDSPGKVSAEQYN